MRVKTKKYYGFTLVELLVVISIIALLLSILMPSLGRARGQAKKVACGARMKQHGLGVGMYANDYKGFLPPVISPVGWAWPADAGSYWQVQIAKAIGVKETIGNANMPTGPMWYCTQQSKHPTRPFASWYAMNTNLVIWNAQSAPNRITAVKASAVKQPAKIVFETDAVEHVITFDYDWPNWAYPRFAGKKVYVDDPRHLGQCNILWVDLHSSSLARKDFMTNSSVWAPKSR